jgi:hypothetical protein
MEKIDLNSYSKEVLIQYIKRYCLYRKDDIDRVKSQLEFEQLMKKSVKLQEKMNKLTGIEHIHEYVKLMNEDRKIQKKIDKNLGL